MGPFQRLSAQPRGQLAIDTSTASIDEVLKEARREGATVVQVNHPFIPFGYFTSLAAGVAPGGFNPGFDLVEFNSSATADDAKVFAGSVSSGTPGSATTRPPAATPTMSGTSSPARSAPSSTWTGRDPCGFAQALKAGHAYVSYGPLVFPAVLFGTTLKVKAGAPFTLGFDLASAAGLRKVEVISGKTAPQDRLFADAPLKSHVDFTERTAHSTWYALVVEDAAGHKAYTDPIGVEVTPAAPAATHP